MARLKEWLHDSGLIGNQTAAEAQLIDMEYEMLTEEHAFLYGGAWQIESRIGIFIGNTPAQALARYRKGYEKKYGIKDQGV